MSEHSGVGMPTALLLEEYTAHLVAVFGMNIYQVGSSLPGSGNSEWRDVDVRAIIDDEEYERQGFGDPDRMHDNAKWVATAIAFSLLGWKLTGLPIDFQIQQRSHANAKYADGRRSALGLRRYYATLDASSRLFE